MTRVAVKMRPQIVKLRRYVFACLCASEARECMGPLSTSIPHVLLYKNSPFLSDVRDSGERIEITICELNLKWK